MSHLSAAMHAEMVRVESAVSATASGNLTQEKWTYDVQMALGFAGIRNPLGFAIVRYLSDQPSSMLVWEIVLLLATRIMQETGEHQEQARRSAWAAFDWWRDSRCYECGGRGVTDAAQRTCFACRGTGQRKMPEGPAGVREAISYLISAEDWMESQIAMRMRRLA